jgi:hypothetical protein
MLHPPVACLQQFNACGSDGFEQVGVTSVLDLSLYSKVTNSRSSFNIIWAYAMFEPNDHLVREERESFSVETAMNHWSDMPYVGQLSHLLFELLCLPWTAWHFKNPHICWLGIGRRKQRIRSVAIEIGGSPQLSRQVPDAVAALASELA